jgi:hypothetical protein
VTRTIKRGVIDTIDYAIDTERGTIRATDGTNTLVAAKIAAATAGAPTTLRARARWALGIAKIVDITVEADPPEGDPTVGGTIAEEATVWAWLNTSALDVLHAVWLDPDNVIRFRDFGIPRDNGLSIGGTGIPLSNLSPKSTLDGVHSRIIAYDVTAPAVKVIRTDLDAQNTYGDNYLERTRPVPAAGIWADSVLADRSNAALQYDLGTLRPRTEAELVALLDTGMVDIAHVLVATRNEGREILVPAIEASPRILGGTFEANTLTGWSASLVTYIPAKEWDGSELPAPPPPAPPPPTQTVIRTYVVNKDSRLALTSGGSKYGSGTEHELPVGSWSGWRNRALLAFAAIPWGDVISVVSAELRLWTTTQVNIGFGSTPKIRVKRVTSNWSEGSASSPSGANAVIYPGPGVTATGETVVSITGSQSTQCVIPITAIVKAWAPVLAGGSGLANYGVALYSYAEDSPAYTTEFSAREAGSSVDAEIRITVKIPA